MSDAKKPETEPKDEQKQEPKDGQGETPKVVPYEEFEAIKKAQAGSDKAYNETKKQLEDLAKKYDDLQKRNMSDKERQELETQEKQKAIEAKEREVAEASLRLTRMSLIAEMGLAKDFDRYAVGSTEEEIKESLNSLQTLINKEAEKLVNEKIKRPGTPKVGGPPKTDINAMIRGVYESRRGR
jgi:hypothetical protein